MSRSPEQQRVVEWLRDDLKLPVFAGAYEGALLLLENKPAGYVTFVSHAGRDIMNTLARTVEGIEAKRVQYTQLVGKLEACWMDEWRERNLSEANTDADGHVIPHDVCKHVSILVDEHRAGSLRSSDADFLFFSTFLEYSERSRIPENFLTDWKCAKNWFLVHAHLRKNAFADNVDVDLKSNFTRLHGFLYVAASTQYERLKGLDEILEDTNK